MQTLTFVFVAAPLLAALLIPLAIQHCRRYEAHLELRDEDGLKPLAPSWHEQRERFRFVRNAICIVALLSWLSALLPLYIVGFASLSSQLGSITTWLALGLDTAAYIVLCTRMLSAQITVTNHIVRRCVWGAI
jgi:hypothetical protein